MAVRSLLSSAIVAALTLSALANSPLRIEVDPDGFHASRADIHAVCHSAAGQLLRHLPDLDPLTIAVSKGAHGPIALFDRGDNGKYRVRLDTGGTYWSQYLAKWHRAVPDDHKAFVHSLAALFGVELP